MQKDTPDNQFLCYQLSTPHKTPNLQDLNQPYHVALLKTGQATGRDVLLETIARKTFTMWCYNVFYYVMLRPYSFSQHGRATLSLVKVHWYHTIISFGMNTAIAQRQWERGGISNSLSSSYLISVNLCLTCLYNLYATIHLFSVLCPPDNTTFCKNLWYMRVHHPELILFPTIREIINQLVFVCTG